MSNHGTALSDDTIIRVDRSTPVVYPHYWWLKNVPHPEFQAKGPPEYDLETVRMCLSPLALHVLEWERELELSNPSAIA